MFLFSPLFLFFTTVFDFTLPLAVDLPLSRPTRLSSSSPGTVAIYVSQAQKTLKNSLRGRLGGYLFLSEASPSKASRLKMRVRECEFWRYQTLNRYSLPRLHLRVILCPPVWFKETHGDPYLLFDNHIV